MELGCIIFGTERPRVALKSITAYPLVLCTATTDLKLVIVKFVQRFQKIVKRPKLMYWSLYISFYTARSTGKVGSPPLRSLYTRIPWFLGLIGVESFRISVQSE